MHLKDLKIFKRVFVDQNNEEAADWNIAEALTLYNT